MKAELSKWATVVVYAIPVAVLFTILLGKVSTPSEALSSDNLLMTISVVGGRGLASKCNYVDTDAEKVLHVEGEYCVYVIRSRSLTVCNIYAADGKRFMHNPILRECLLGDRSGKISE